MLANKPSKVILPSVPPIVVGFDGTELEIVTKFEGSDGVEFVTVSFWFGKVFGTTFRNTIVLGAPPKSSTKEITTL